MVGSYPVRRKKKMHQMIKMYNYYSFYTLAEQIFTLILTIFVLTRYYAKLKKMEEEREQELASKYRDRVSYE